MPTLTPGQLAVLAAIDSPTVANAIERFRVRRRIDGYADRDLRCAFPQLGTMVGYAVTCTADSTTEGRSDGAGLIGLWAALEAAPKPAVLVIKDVGPDPRKGCHMGEIMATIAKTLGAVGCVSDGGLRDVREVEALGGFQYFCPGFVVSHGRPVILDVNVPVAVHGLSIEPGTPPQQVASAWVAAGVQTDPRFLYAWFRYSGQARKIRAGSYEIHAGVTPRELLDKMVRGDQVLEQLRLIEGWNFRQLRAAIAAAPALKQTTAAMTDEQIMAALGAPGQAPEGRFFPDTYAYSLGVSDLTVLKRAHALMQKRLESAWSGRSDGLPLKSADEALVLASIVEKETGAAADRGLVAAVFVNRLKAGMPLQTDPTVIYGLGTDFDGNLRKIHLQTDTPFNTYTRGGLPPTPIAMPGLAALQATLHPTPSKALYFVSRGDGTSQFSEDLAAHNRAVNKYQRGR